MSDWTRSTREITVETIQPEMATAIQEHIESYNLGPILKTSLMCVETTSEKKKKGLFAGGGIRTTLSVCIVTPEWLIISIRTDKDGVGILTVQLKDSVIIDYANSPAFKLIPDSGLEVSGTFTGRVGMNSDQRITSFIPLGSEHAARTFRDTLFQAYQKTRK